MTVTVLTPRRPKPDQPPYACSSGEYGDLFVDPQSRNDLARAKGVCGNCEMQPACLEGALTSRKEWGIWGGVLFVNGRPLKKFSFPKEPARLTEAGPGAEPHAGTAACTEDCTDDCADAFPEAVPA